jgi:hypothetical protein
MFDTSIKTKSNKEIKPGCRYSNRDCDQDFACRSCPVTSRRLDLLDDYSRRWNNGDGDTRNG